MGAAGCFQAATVPQGCKQKVVGLSAYIMLNETDTKEHGCKDNFVYEKLGSPGSRFCFKKGDLSAACKDDVPAEEFKTNCIFCAVILASCGFGRTRKRFHFGRPLASSSPM